MKDITIKITGRRYESGELEDEMEFISEAQTFERNGARYFLYDESEFSGYPGCKTSLKIKDKTIRMKRVGEELGGYGTELTFEEGKRFISRFSTPFGSFDMEVFTNNVKADLSPDGLGKIVLDYAVSFEGYNEGRNEIDIEIMQ